MSVRMQRTGRVGTLVTFRWGAAVARGEKSVGTPVLLALRFVIPTASQMLSFRPKGGICLWPAPLRRKRPADSSTAKRRFGMTKVFDRLLFLFSPYQSSLNPCHSDRREESAFLSTRITAGPPQPSARSSQVGLRSSIRATFFSRRHFFISVSRAIASPTL